MATGTIQPHLRRRPSSAQALSQAAAGLAVGGVAAGLTAFQNSHRAVLAVAVIIVVAGTVWCATTRRPALALAILMLYLGLLDGYLKLATGSNYVTFVRDAMLFALAAGVLMRATIQRKELQVPPLGAWAVAYIVVVLVQLANPNNGSLYHSLAGVRQHLEFVPLFFLTFTYVRTTAALRVFVLLMVVIGLVNGVADVVQFNESPQQLAAWGPGYRDRVLPHQIGFGGRTFYSATGQQETRPFGLGSDSGDGGLMAAFAIGGVLALVSIPGRRRYVPFAVVAGAVAIAGVITAQGRAVIVCAFAVAFAYALLSVTSRIGFRAILSLFLTAVIAVAAYQSVIGGSGSSGLRTANLSVGNLLSTTAKNRGFSLDRIPTYLVQHPFGDGLGTGGPAVGVKGAPPQAGVLDSENELNFAIIETGIPGLIVLLGFPITIVLLAMRRNRREQDPEARVLLAAIFAPIFALLVLYSVTAITPKVPAGPYLWGVGGIAAYWLLVRPRAIARSPSSEPSDPLPSGVGLLECS